MCAQNLCNLIWGMARLAEHPGPELMRKFLQKSEELLEATDPEGEEEKGQGIANTLWALAVLDELRPEFVEQVPSTLTSCAVLHPSCKLPRSHSCGPLPQTARLNLKCGTSTSLLAQAV